MSMQSAIRLATGMALLGAAHPLAAQDTASVPGVRVLGEPAEAAVKVAGDRS